MRFLIAGSSGFLGAHLTQRLRMDGHRVTALVRRTAGPSESSWDPYAGRLDRDLIEDHDVVVNLAGSPTIGNPHSGTWARRLRESRVTTTRVLAEAVAASSRKPAFLAGNAVAFYGDHANAPVPESAESRGDALMTVVTREWQDAADAATEAGARVCVLRTTPLMDRSSAPLKQLRLLFSLGLGGPVGTGRQYFPVITLRDWLDAVVFLAESDVAGPVNLCCPQTPSNKEFTRALAAQVHRPAFLKVPGPAVKAAAGKVAPQLLGSVRAVPQVLLDAGFTFSDPDIASVLTTGLAGYR
jgi:uncharacterized protein (TIGR01777 family)